MTDSTERAQVFGRAAAAYDAARPTYPRGAISHIQGLVPARRAIEVGAGTGKATIDMAVADVQITCLEPSSEMAEILIARDLPGVSVVVSTLEGWEPETRSFDLVYAAQAWHWVDHDTAYQQVLDFLRPGGVLALMWNIPLDRYEPFVSVYEEHAPELLAEHDRRIQKRDSVTWGEDMSDAGFTDVGRATFEWSDELTASGLRGLYSTYSDHLMLPGDQRNRLLDALHDAVVDNGGLVEIGYRTEVFSGRKS